MANNRVSARRRYSGETGIGSGANLKALRELPKEG
jgi:hypothetical protein